MSEIYYDKAKPPKLMLLYINYYINKNEQAK